MNEAYNELMRISEAVCFVEKHHDVNPTIQKLKFIKEQIKLIDSKFVKEFGNKFTSHSFYFGDKYFAPLNKDYCICIPKKSNPNDINKYIKDQELFDEIIKNFNLYTLQDCIFDITTKDNEDNFSLRMVKNNNK
jgi:hypothetical protein